MIKPITPSEAKTKALGNIPDFVIEAFNNKISQNLDSQGNAKVLQNQVIGEIMYCANERNIEVTREEIFAKRWLDVEKLFSDNGWIVKYDKPGYNESYEAYFNFSTKC